MKVLYLLAYYFHFSQAVDYLYDLVQDPTPCGQHKSAPSCAAISLNYKKLIHHHQFQIPEPPFSDFVFKKTRQWSLHGLYLVEYDLDVWPGYAVILFGNPCQDREKNECVTYSGYFEFYPANLTRRTYTLESNYRDVGPWTIADYYCTLLCEIIRYDTRYSAGKSIR